MDHIAFSTSTASPCLVILRGPAATGKSTIATLLREQWKPRSDLPVAYLEQDYFRNVIAGGQEGCRDLSATLLLQAVKPCLDAGYHVILEGILNAQYYRSMLFEATDYCGRSHTHIYYLEASLELTRERHLTRPKAAVFGVDSLDEWYPSATPLQVANEKILSAEMFTAQQIVDIILTDATQ